MLKAICNYLTAALFIGMTTAFAADDINRFDNGPFFPVADEYLEACSSVLNTAENSPVRLSSIALVQRASGGRAGRDSDLAARSLDEVARFFVMSVDGWAATSVTLQFVRTFSADPSTQPLAMAMKTGVSRFPDGSEVQAPLGQRISMFHGDMLSTGGALLERSRPKSLAGNYIATVEGTCAFDNGPVAIVQDQFLLEGQRGEALLFWGAIGETRAYVGTSDHKFLKITLKRRGKRAQVEFPDKSSELFSASLDEPVLTLTGEFFGDCEIVLIPQEKLPDTVADERPTTRMVQEPPEELTQRVDTPGTSLDMQELGRSGKGRKLEVTYKFVASGFPPDHTYSIWRFKPQPDPLQLIEGLAVDESGTMIVNECCGADDEWVPAPLETALPMTFHNIAPAEAFQFGIVADDNSVAAYATVYPVPIEAFAGSCHLVLERLNPGQTAYRAHVTGLQPDEELRIESESDGTVLRSVAQADANGRFSAYVFPELLGQSYGTAEYHVEAGSCALGIDYDWGVR